MRRLSFELSSFIDQKVDLFKLEVTQKLKGYLHDTYLLAGGVALLILAVTALSFALGFFCASLIPLSMPVALGIGFLILTIAYVVAGIVLLKLFKRRIHSRRVEPTRTIEELRRDKQWLDDTLR